ncbi:DUF1365 domain-containing protein [Gimesia aquarii]|nr:DUF1365 domain-containing protein [Gimesia aquarii]
MESGIYEGWVRHRRFAPVEHSFLNRIFLMYLDLDELDNVFRGRLLWSVNRTALARFYRKDHLGDPQKSLSESVREIVVQNGYPKPEGPIRLLTHLRYFGFVMNPVSFYFCFDRNSEHLQNVVAEVNNTPWGEQHCYVLDAAQFTKGSNRKPIEKEFHVSPFMPMDMQYYWRLSEPQDTLMINIENHQLKQKKFDVTMQLQRREITSASLMRSLLRFPLMTYYVFVAIYWQALRLWIKRVPFYPHPKHSKSTEQSTNSAKS